MSLSVSVYADTTSCVDAETGGEVIRLYIDWSKNKVIINGRNLNISGENRDGTGILTTAYFDKNRALKKYLIFREKSQLGTYEIWVSQFGFDEKSEPVWPNNSSVKRMTCKKSFIKPFLKYKYS